MAADLLTKEERRAVSLLGEVAGLFSDIVGDGITRDADLQEAVTLIHGLQNMILAQAAARANPQVYRLLGEVCRPPESVEDEK